MWASRSWAWAVMAKMAALAVVPSRMRVTNAAAEALNSLYKRELIDPGKDWQGVDDVMLATMDWVQWYNEDRIHSYSGDMPPKKYEEIYYQALETGKLTSSSQT
jgi:transposase InsO family protein